MAQHYGLPTRLLDWTKNPLAALYFALYDSTNQVDASVYIYEFGPLREGHKHMIDLNDPPAKNPLKYDDGANRFIPPIVDSRMSAQSSVFTIQRDPLVPITICENKNIDVVTIDKNCREELRKNLHRLGINQAALFPDISGLAATLRWVWEHYRYPTA